MEDNLVQLSEKEAILEGAKSLTSFGHLFLPKTFRLKSPDMHVKMGQSLYGPQRKVMFLVFRDGAKTSILRAFTLQRVCYSISKTVMFVSASQDHSIHSLRWLKRQVERNTNLRAFHLRPGDKWTDEWIEIVNEITEERTNILAAGITGQIRGFNVDDFRPDLIIADDILTDVNTKTVEQREKTSELFFGGLVNSLQAETEAPHAKIVLLQTPFNREDLAVKCSQDPSWNPQVFGILDENEKSRWEDKFPTATVIQDREDNIRAGRKRLWTREKMCKIVKTEDVALNSELFMYWETIPQGLTRVIAIDPASSDSKRADENVVMTAGAMGSDLYILAYKTSKGTMPDECASYFFEQALMFGPILKAGAESVSYQRVLKWYIEQEMIKRRIFIPMHGIDDRRRKNDRIIQELGGLLGYRHIYIHPSMTSLIIQVDEFDPTIEDQRDDLLDAAAMCARMLSFVLRSPYTIEAQATVIDEDKYEKLGLIGGCP